MNEIVEKLTGPPPRWLSSLDPRPPIWLSRQPTAAMVAKAAAPKWRDSLLKSIDQNKEVKFSTFFQLATVRLDNKPANRTMVYRGFAKDSCMLTFTTDRRSPKLHHVEKNPWSEVCWYFTESREQYRLGGKLTIVTQDEKDADLKQLWRQKWSELSPGGRAWFLWPDSDKPRTPHDEDFKPDPPSPDDEPLSNYCLGVLDIEEAEHLLLRENHRLEYHSMLEGGKRLWEEKDMNP